LAVQSAGAGRFGTYDSCRRGEGKVSEAEEIKGEVNILAGDSGRTLNVIYEAHPDEEPLVNVILILNLSCSGFF